MKIKVLKKKCSKKPIMSCPYLIDEG